MYVCMYAIVAALISQILLGATTAAVSTDSDTSTFAKPRLIYVTFCCFVAALRQIVAHVHLLHIALHFCFVFWFPGAYLKLKFDGRESRSLLL